MGAILVTGKWKTGMKKLEYKIWLSATVGIQDYLENGIGAQTLCSLAENVGGVLYAERFAFNYSIRIGFQQHITQKDIPNIMERIQDAFEDQLIIINQEQ